MDFPRVLIFNERFLCMYLRYRDEGEGRAGFSAYRARKTPNAVGLSVFTRTGGGNSRDWDAAADLGADVAATRWAFCF